MENRFDQLASQWDQQASRVKMATEIAEEMCRALRLVPDRDLLDFGAGTGLVTLRLQPHVRKVFHPNRWRRPFRRLPQRR
jgi:ubiquinone/menaquinone biosynthesis C-methylase UbiE